MIRSAIVMLLASVVFALSGCVQTAKISSKTEARYRINEQMHWGLITKDEYTRQLRRVPGLPLPEKSTRPLDTAAIQRNYKRMAQRDPLTVFTRQYNSGQIGSAGYHAIAANMLSSRKAARKPLGDSLYKADKTAQFSSKPKYVPGYTGSKYDPNSLANPYGAGNPYKPDGLMNPYSQYGSRFSNKSWTNPYAKDAPKLYDANGKYRGRLSTNKFDPESTSNPFGRYGNKFSPDSINNKFGAGNPFNPAPIYVVPQR